MTETPKGHPPRFGELDGDGHVIDTDDNYALWHIAAYLPKDREAEVAAFLAGQGIEVYRMWPVRIEEH